MDRKITEINKKLNEANSIEEFYADTTIFVTGATGFVGKGLLETLLRLCSRITAIFILLRPRKGQTTEQRFKKLIDDPVFEFIRAEHGPSIFSKLHPVEGDMSLPELGLSPKDRIMLIEKVNIVFNVAAAVDFKQPLDEAVNINTKGASRVVDLCKELKHLISFVNVGTAYSNAHIQEIEEKVYTTCWKPSAVIDICDKQDKNSIALLEEAILKIHRNTYLFTKNLAEQIVFNDCKSFPTAIVRPSVIGGSLEQPCAGWVANLYGLTALGLLISHGNVKIVLTKKDGKLDLVPVDYVIHTIICAAWHVTIRPDNEVKVYNCTSNADLLRWGDIANMYMECSTEMPMNNLLWYPFCKIVESKFIYNILIIFLHLLPAFVIDIGLKLRGKKPMMMKINKHFNKLNAAVEYFAFHEWFFHRDNVHKMAEDIKVLKDSDKVILDLQHIDWKRYIANYHLGCIKFILKEKSDPKAVQRLSVFYWIHNITLIFLAVVLLGIILYVLKKLIVFL